MSYMPKCDRCEHYNSCVIQQRLAELYQELWNINREKCGRTDGFIDGHYVKDIAEPRINCSTCGYSPQTPSCDTCEGYSNWWALEQTEPCDECVFVKGSGWCDNCNGKPKGLDALPNSRKAEQTERSE